MMKRKVLFIFLFSSSLTLFCLHSPFLSISSLDDSPSSFLLSLTFFSSNFTISSILSFFLLLLPPHPSLYIVSTHLTLLPFLSSSIPLFSNLHFLLLLPLSTSHFYLCLPPFLSSSSTSFFFLFSLLLLLLIYLLPISIPLIGSL